MENRIVTYTHFAPFFEQLLEDVRGARHHVHVQFFKFESDAVGMQLGAAMAERAGAGVEARLMYDDLMCLKWKWYYKELEDSGIQTAGFAPVRLSHIRRECLYRNHRKVIVIDGRIGYVGGMNVAERYYKGLGWGEWRDTMIRIEGDAVGQLQLCFLDDWRRCCKRSPEGEGYFPHVSRGGSEVEILTSDPERKNYSIMDYTVGLLDSAKRYVWFESPYFIPTEEVMDAMCRAGRRGVDVRLLQPPRGDRGETTQWASKYNYQRAMEAGVKIGTYGSGFLHSKIIIFDDRVAVVGSCNIDPRSYLLCHEVAAVVNDEDYARQLRDIFLADEAKSVYVKPEEWRRRPWHQKVKEMLSNIISSQL